MKVWILTYEVNEYDQCGEYFAAVYGQRPTLEQLLTVDGMDQASAKRLYDGQSGRWKKEYMWWYLREFDITSA